MPIRAALFDYGGVILTSPFEAFARYERGRGLPEGAIRRVNATDPDTNAWARLERSEIDLGGFARQFTGEARALGYDIPGEEVLALLAGDIRPAMVTAVERCRDRLKTALLTNNFVTARRDDVPPPHAEVLDLFDVVVESSRLGVRKPDVRFYEHACASLDIEPDEAVFLDDLGVNLKPARAMGMATIKVVDPDDALVELEEILGFAVR